MTKRYRDEKGELTISIGQIAKETADEAAKYYQIGGIYLNATNGEELCSSRKSGQKLPTKKRIKPT